MDEFQCTFTNMILFCGFAGSCWWVSLQAPLLSCFCFQKPPCFSAFRSCALGYPPFAHQWQPKRSASYSWAFRITQILGCCVSCGPFFQKLSSLPGPLHYCCRTFWRQLRCSIKRIMKHIYRALVEMYQSSWAGFAAKHLQDRTQDNSPLVTWPWPPGAKTIFPSVSICHNGELSLWIQDVGDPLRSYRIKLDGFQWLV